MWGERRRRLQLGESTIDRFSLDEVHAGGLADTPPMRVQKQREQSFEATARTSSAAVGGVHRFSSDSVRGPDGAELRDRRPGEVGGAVDVALGGHGLRRCPFARMHSRLNGRCDEIREGVGPVLGHLVEGAPCPRAVAAESTSEGEQ